MHEPRASFTLCPVIARNTYKADHCNLYITNPCSNLFIYAYISAYVVCSSVRDMTMNVIIHTSLRDYVHSYGTMEQQIKEKECKGDVASFHYDGTNSVMMRFSEELNNAK